MANVSDSIPSRIPVRDENTHKGDYGRALLIGGSQGMSGAIALGGMAALRSGAGLVTLATAESVASIVATFNPCYMTFALPDDDAGRIQVASTERFAAHLEAADAIAIGPGLGRSPELTALLREMWRDVDAPLVIDADGLNALAEDDFARQQPPGGPRVLTPHPGEFRRLCTEAPTERAEMEKAATAFAKAANCLLVLKGHESLVSDGDASFHNPSGNPGMATGGAGDVLTGVITALLAANDDVMLATRQAVYVHGLAGDMAADHLGETSLTALDICESLPAAFQRFGG